jgi:predicted XRE-type DNA-binding protein
MTMGQVQRRRTVESVDDDEVVHRGSGNFLADQGIEDTEEFRVKAHLCHEIATILETRGLTQEQAAKITGQKQADISRIVNSRFDDYSVWRLMKMLASLGANILIVINPASEGAPGITMSQTVDEPDLESERNLAPSSGM